MTAPPDPKNFADSLIDQMRALIRDLGEMRRVWGSAPEFVMENLQENVWHTALWRDQEHEKWLKKNHHAAKTNSRTSER